MYSLKTHYKPGRIKFPPSNQINGEVKTYFLSQEEIKSKYGISPKIIFTKEMYQEMRKKRMTTVQMAEVTGLPAEQIYHLSQQYRFGRRPDKEEKKEIKVDVKGITIENLTPEKYLELKNSGLSDLEISKQIKTNQPLLSRWKKANGLSGYSKRKMAGTENGRAV